MTRAPAIVVLAPSALATARRLQAACAGAQVHGLQSRVEADVAFAELGAHLRALYASGTPIVALCAAGIVIRCVAPMLANKGMEPPVLAVAEDGSAVVPLLGGLAGVNAMAREIARALDVAPAITTSGELRFGTCLLSPPQGYALASLEQGKRFVSDLLAGHATRIEGEAPWLDDATLPRDPSAAHTIRITPQTSAERADELVIHPRSVVAAVCPQRAASDELSIAARIRQALRESGLAPLSLAAVLAPMWAMSDPALAEAARALGVPLRFAAVTGESSGGDSAPGSGADLPSNSVNSNSAAHAGHAENESGANGWPASWLLAAALHQPHEALAPCDDIALGVAGKPIDVATLGQARGRLYVVGLGPGSTELMAPAARAALTEANDVLGYETYVRMAGPFRDDQRVHASDNREELQRARHAFALASEGRTVAVVSSGDPGIFAMAAAVLEALDASDNPHWHAVELRILPGISAAMATAAEAGAPLGHDFCVLSLSDNLKPWAVIEDRLRHAAQADLVMAFYNPISRARPWQLDRALAIVRAHREPHTRVVLGRDVGRPGAAITTTTLGELRSDQVDMRTTVIVGSSTTRGVPGGPHGEWIYTPRSYGDRP
ncbi:precorrin-3B C(17)-methyltransferase [Trinickia caryophylli]|nr:precorrin-3B C(17)-methyltransferase [Trinickia caryophylli]PMS09937.1 precorrin-3B C(17)-methyltransferase [Trinickia caryophylli]TRX14909.1 precorrin-3B C(17)-methyltransferase [Trinickia caryophylli]WQE14759.1 precorrin-3B C(17)-methyltransferase [Trinickia caryophylli]